MTNPDLGRIWPFRVGMSALVLSVCLGLLTGVADPASAHPVINGSEHDYGEMVEYDLVFPVAGKNWYSDWFWAARTGGFHHAQDLMAEKMVPVLAAADGTVGYVNWSSDPTDLNEERCCSMTINHDDGWSSWYIHLNNDTSGTDDGQGWGIATGIIPGARVEAGQLIGWVGDSGNAENTGSHVQFELRDPEGIIVNPYQALRAAEAGVPPSTATCLVTRPADARDLLRKAAVVGLGDRGAHVEQLQAFLSTFGYQTGPIDGVFGPQTAAAVASFQVERNLSADGLVGDSTRSEIKSLLRLSRLRAPLLLDAPVLARGDKARGVRHLKVLLVKVGQNPGRLNRAFNRQTAKALKAFQRLEGLVPDGVLGPRSAKALAEKLGIEQVRACPLG